MQDRIPTKILPNGAIRYEDFDAAGNSLGYRYTKRADEPTQEGDLLNKANLLPDDVATALGLTGNPQPKDALSKIKTLIDSNTALVNAKSRVAIGTYTGTGTNGVNNKNSITVPFTPYLAFIKADYESAGGTSFPMVKGNNSVAIWEVGNQITSIAANYAKLEWLANGVRWWSDASAARQLNNDGIIFTYVVIGM